MTPEQEDLILKYFKFPGVEDYDPIMQKRWEESLRDSFVFGCDWLAHFVERWNPLPAVALGRTCVRLDAYVNDAHERKEEK
jgi:hypothetical protein